ncbi:hypothetical protein [Nocardia rhamnosiphila]
MGRPTVESGELHDQCLGIASISVSSAVARSRAVGVLPSFCVSRGVAVVIRPRSSFSLL